MSESEIDKILADVKEEGTPLADVLKDTATESLPEKEPEVEKPVEGNAETPETPEENVPFHKHPRWIERENELKDLREREEATARELAEFKSAQEKSTEKPAADIPDWFKELHGSSQAAWDKFSERERERDTEIEQRVIKAQEEKQVKAQEEVKYWDGWVKTEIDKLRADGHQFDENEFKALMLEVMPTDLNNNLDFNKGITLYEKLHPKDTAASEARKELADNVTRSTSKEPTKKDYMTPADLRGRSMMSL